jgi:predicted transcriptional regulator
MSIDQTRRLLLSVRPRFAAAILDGTKTVELRRTRPRIVVPTECLLYASTPVQAVVGICRITKVLEYKPRGLWRVAGEGCGINYSEFAAYFDGCDKAYGLLITRAEQLDSAIPLSTLRRRSSGFQPPQSFRYLTFAHSDRLLARTW